MYVCDPTCSIYVLPDALFLIFCCGKWYNSCVCIQCIPSGSCLSYFHYLKNYYNKLEPESRIELPTSSLPRKRSTTELPRLFLPLQHALDALWWGEKDSNLRRLSRQIYSLIPLTAWVSPHAGAGNRT